MSDLYDQIVGQRGRLESIVARIPGFRGYQDKQARRKADRMLRDYVAGQLSEQIARMVRLEKKLLNQGGLSHMSEAREAKTKMQTYHDRVKTAAPKYSGMWSSMKIGSEELERIYSFDEAQIRYVDRFSNALDELEAAIDSGEGIDDAIASVYDSAVEANEAFALRDDVLTNLSQSL